MRDVRKAEATTERSPANKEARPRCHVLRSGITNEGLQPCPSVHSASHNQARKNHTLQAARAQEQRTDRLRTKLDMILQQQEMMKNEKHNNSNTTTDSDSES